MRTLLTSTLCAALFAAVPVSAQTLTGLAKIYDDQVNTIAGDALNLAKKMPADKFNFKPATGTPPNGMFDGVRSFDVQVKHIATIMYQISASVLGGEKPPVDIGTTDNGPDALKSKDEVIAYFEGALAYAHKAMRTITAQNAFDEVPSPFGRGTMQRAAAAAFLGLHSFDHYGQMVVYARLNGITPGGAPPAPKGKGGKGKAK